METNNKNIKETVAIQDDLDKNYWKLIWKRIVKDWRLYVMIAPMIFVFLFWRYFPLYQLIVAFKLSDATLLPIEQNFVGFQHFKNLMFGSMAGEFWRAFRNTFVLSFYGLLFGFPVPIILALMFSEVKSNGVRSVFQVCTYLPKFVSTVVVTTIVTLLLRAGSSYSNPGVLSTFLAKIGLITEEAAQSGIMYGPQYFRAVYQVSGIWETAGYGSIVYFAAIIGISPASYEAARIDGASKLAQIKYVVLPSILSTITIMLILRIGELLTIGYEKVLLLYNINTYVTADVVSTFVARIGGLETGGVAGGNQNIASAADMLNAIISMLLVMGANLISKKASNTSLY